MSLPRRTTPSRYSNSTFGAPMEHDRQLAAQAGSDHQHFATADAAKKASAGRQAVATNHRIAGYGRAKQRPGFHSFILETSQPSPDRQLTVTRWDLPPITRRIRAPRIPITDRSRRHPSAASQVPLIHSRHRSRVGARQASKPPSLSYAGRVRARVCPCPPCAQQSVWSSLRTPHSSTVRRVVRRRVAQPERLAQVLADQVALLEAGQLEDARPAARMRASRSHASMPASGPG